MATLTTADQQHIPAEDSVRQRGEDRTLSPEEKILQNAEQLTNPHGFALDPALMNLGGNTNQSSAGKVQFQNGETTNHTEGNSSIAGLEPHDRDGTLSTPIEDTPAQGTADTAPEDLDSQPGGDGDNTEESGAAEKAAKKKASNAKSEELRRLWREHEGSTMDGATAKLREDLANPQAGASDKSKHVFAMIWAKTFCRRGSTFKVARDVVYSHYEDACEAASVVPLNHANFGKCLSTVYPNIKIRRLGPRGESKYNYWGLELVPQQAQTAVQPSGSKRNSRNARPQAGNPHTSSFMNGSKLPSETAVFPAFLPDLDIPAMNTPGMVVFNSIVLDPTIPSLQDLVAEDNLVRRELLLPSSFEPGPTSKENINIEFPDIGPYMPQDVDPVIIDQFKSVYQSNCVTTIAHFLTLRTSLFYKSASFASAAKDLDTPAREMLDNPSLAPWIEQCDRKMYVTMVQCLPPLVFDQIPEEALDAIKRISKELMGIVANRFVSHPLHVYTTKVKLASLFGRVLDRFVRVYNAIQGVTDVLKNRINRGSMYRDWVASVDIVRIVQNELPNCGYLEVVNILSDEIGRLLEPFDTELEFQATANSGATFQAMGSHDEPPIHTILQRWGDFLMSLPRRFPHADTRRVITCTKLISMAALQDIGANNCVTFPYWWMTKVWIDELITFYAEAGGFCMNPSGLVNQGVRPSSSAGPETGTGAVSGPVMAYPANHHSHEDSALGLELPEDELSTSVDKRVEATPHESVI